MPITSERASAAGNACRTLAAALLLAHLAGTPAHAQDAAELVDHTLTGTNQSGDTWAAYYAPDGSLYTLNSSTGASFVDDYTVEGGRLCYPSEEFGTRCWDVRVEGNLVTVASEERGSFTEWTMRPGDPLGLQASEQSLCVRTQFDSECA